MFDKLLDSNIPIIAHAQQITTSIVMLLNFNVNSTTFSLLKGKYKTSFIFH